MDKLDARLFKIVDTSNLIINGFGYFLGKESNRLVIKDHSKKLFEYSMDLLNHIYITSNCTLSTSFINSACRKGIKICIWSRGKPNVLVSSPQLAAFVEAKRSQFSAYNNHVGVEAIKKVISSKIINQQNVIKYFSKNSSDNTLMKFSKQSLNNMNKLLENLYTINGNNLNDVRSSILNIEALCAKEYWGVIRKLAPPGLNFKGRDYNSNDVLNVSLNFMYSLLYSNIWMAILNSGLEPFAGFLHTDRPGKASLVYDLSEPFKQRLVDKIIIGMLRKKQKLSIKKGKLSDKTIKILSEKFAEELLKRENYNGKNLTLNSIIQSNIYSFVSELKSTGEYIFYRFKW